MDYLYEIKKLKSSFRQSYPSASYPEMLTNDQRSYNCIVLETHYDYYICIPFRSNMRHNNGFHFRTSARSRQTCSGLDYSKMLIINDASYFESGVGIVDSDEYVEMRNNIETIVMGALKYLDDYIAYQKGELEIGSEVYRRTYQYTTLKYFHSIIL